MNKTGLNWHEDWVEILGLNFMIIGLLISLSTGSAFMNYLVILISGLLSGRIIYFRKHKLKLSVMIIIILFVLGYLLGSRHGSTTLTLLFFILGTVGSYRLHLDGYLK